MQSAYSHLRELLIAVLECDDDTAVEKTNSRIILADLGGVDTNQDAQRIRSGSEPMRKAAAHIYAHNIAQEGEVGERARTYLQLYFADDNAEVLRHVSLAFADLDGEQLLKFESLVATFIESPAFEDEPEYFLRSLEESCVELPHVICQAANRVLEFLGEDGASIAHGGALAAGSISKLIVRQYAQTQDTELKRNCLDLIDQVERRGYMGISEELAKVDR